MFDLFSLLKKPKSGDIAKDRLKLVLIHDRARFTKLTADVLEMLRNDIIQVIKKYVEVDDEGLDIQIAQPDDSNNNNEPVSILCANIPIKNMRKFNPN